MNILTEKMKNALILRIKRLAAEGGVELNEVVAGQNLHNDGVGKLVDIANIPVKVLLSVDRAIISHDESVLESMRHVIEEYVKWALSPAYEFEATAGLSMKFEKNAINARAKAMAAKCVEIAELVGGHEAIRYAEMSCGCAVRGRYEAKCLRISDVKWWITVIEEKIGRQRESVWSRIRPGGLHYASPDALSDYRRGVAKRDKWISRNKGMKLPSHSKKQKARYAGYMARVEALAIICKEAGMRPIFPTFTAPAGLHFKKSSNKGGIENAQSSVSAQDSRNWLYKKFRNAKRGLRRRSVYSEYIWNFDPHEDGTSHMHAVIWVPAEMVEQIKNFLISIYHNNNHESDGDYSRTVHFADIPDEEVVKVVGGYFFKDSAPGSKNAHRLAAWAKANKIRTVGFSSGTGASVWRELRRHELPFELKGSELSALLTASKSGDYLTFMRAYRAGLVSAEYVETCGRYGEKVRSISGCSFHPSLLQPQSSSYYPLTVTYVPLVPINPREGPT